MIPVPELVEITNGLHIGLPSGLRMAQERSVHRPTINRYYLTPVVIAASSWRAPERPVDEVARAVADDICTAYPQRTPAPDCGDIGRIDRSGAPARVLAHFDWETGGGRLVRSHLGVFAGGTSEVAVMHLTVPQRLAAETESIVNQLFESARYQPGPATELSTSQINPAASAVFSQGATTP